MTTTVLTNLTDDELLSEMENLKATVDGLTGSLGRIEQEVYRRMEERAATAIPSETYVCRIESNATYDQLSFAPLKEVFNDGDLKKCLIPAHTEQVDVPDKWRTPTVKSLAFQYGGEALRIFAKARFEQRTRLKFGRRQ